VSLITQEWRLKLLALGLAVLMLGAVAFSQSNTRTLQVNISYINLPLTPNGRPLYGLIAPLDRIAVSVSAPNDLPLTPASVSATVDLSHIKKGPAVSVPIQVKPTDLRIAVQSPPPITLNVDDWITVPLTVNVRTPNQAPGWSVSNAFARCGTSPDHCVVQLSGPASITSKLDAYVTITDAIQEQSLDSLNVPVQFEQTGVPLDMTKLQTLPQIAFLPTTVNVHVDAKQGTASIQVTLVDSTPTHYPPAGYHVTNVVVSPLTVLCTGPAGPAIAGLTSITLPGVDLSHSTSNTTFKVQVPNTVAGVRCSPAVANVTYSISPNPATQASPTPT
jgi:YbbR domain-containing protein